MSSGAASIADISKRLSAFGHALSGSGGAVVALALTYPLDIIKTRLQVQTNDSAYSTHYRSTTDAFLQIIRSEGIPGLYAGLPSALIGSASSNFAYFYWYSFIRNSALRFLRRRQRSKGDDSAVQMGIALELFLGALAGALAQLFTIPVSVITTRQQTQVPPTAATQQQQSTGGQGKPLPPVKVMGMGETALKIIEEEGWTGLWTGLKPSLILTANPAITYGFFESMKTRLLASKKSSSGLSSMEVFMLGLLSKTIATVVTYPYIMAKVRLQWKPADYKMNKKLQYASAVDVLKRVYETDGLTGWYKGMQAQISKAVLSQALLFVIKDKLTVVTFLLFKALQKLTL